MSVSPDLRRIGYVAGAAILAYIFLPNVWGPPPLKRYTTGLVNPGNDCYANSIIQALTVLERLKQWLSEQERTPWVAALQETLDVVGSETHNSRYSTSIRPLLRVMEMKFQTRFSYTQQDAHEMLVHIIDLLEDESTTASPFSGNTTDEILCLKCGYKLENNQRILVVERQPGESILEPQTERITDYRCDSCNQLTTIEKTSRITEFPEILAVHINRSAMQFGQSFRNTKDTEIPLRVGSYALKSVVFHKGYHNRGHYTCARRKSITENAKKWWQVSDETVKEASDNQVLSRKSDAYLLFFEKRNLKYAMSTI